MVHHPFYQKNSSKDEYHIVPDEKDAQTNRRNHRQKTPILRLAAKVIVYGMLFIFLLISMVFLIWYFNVAQTLPSVADLQTKASQFETSQILDRDGNLLYEIVDPRAGRRDYVTIDQISPFMIATTIATEDKDFYIHPGFDLFAILRATVQNLQSGTIVSGASTITQQLARNVLLTAEERTERSILRKTKEIFLAAEITRRYTKDQILELYLNENYYGNYAYGIEAAAKTYFGIPAKYLDFAQAAFLAGLPQAPYFYNFFTNPERTLKRQKTVLQLTLSMSRENDCISVSNAQERLCIDTSMVERAVVELEDYDFEHVNFTYKYPHWVNYIRQILEEEYGAQQALYKAGFTVYTSIDPRLQDLAQEVITRQIDEMAAAHNAHNAALVAIHPDTGEILAMVGSPDFEDKMHSGEVNMATSPRQPGSAIKPLVYAAAFEKGWTPATLLWDVPTEFSPTGLGQDLDYSKPYIPENYDGKFHGPVLLRDALANSYNIPTVKALEFVRVYDDPATEWEDGFVSFAKRMHITTLDKPGFGLALALGGGEVSLLEMTDAFKIFACQGNYIPLTPILKILNNQDETIFEAGEKIIEPVIREEHAYQVNSILSDQAARSPMFGSDSVLNQQFPAAVKTGTTNDFRDNWTVGYTPDIAVGVWVGNADYQPMVDTTGLSGAAPAWAAFIRQAVPMVSGSDSPEFPRPAGIFDSAICSISGTEPSQFCPSIKTEVFAFDQPPLPASEDLWKLVAVNTWTGKLANQFCPNSVEQVKTANVSDLWARQWLQFSAEGNSWAQSVKLVEPGQQIVFTPVEHCGPSDPNPIIQFVNLTDGSEINSPLVEVYGVADAVDGIDVLSLEFGYGTDPQAWYVISSQQNRRITQPEKISDWDLQGLPDGDYTLRLYASSFDGTAMERRIRLRVKVNDHQSNSIQQLADPIMVPVYEDENNIPEFFQIPANP